MTNEDRMVKALDKIAASLKEIDRTLKIDSKNRINERLANTAGIPISAALESVGLLSEEETNEE